MRGFLRGQRLVQVIRVICLFIIAGAVVSGHPPSKAQETAQDTKQDVQISDIQSKLGDLATMQATITRQGEDIARLDQKMTDLFAGLGLLQVLGIGVSFRQYKRKGTA
jgi:hypothetical protein